MTGDTHAPCPVCDMEPVARSFAVNPLFGGGTAWEVRCPCCGLGDGAQWRDEDGAWAAWERFARGDDDEWEDGEWTD